MRPLWQIHNGLRLSVNQRLLLINALLLIAVSIVATMSWRAIDSQRRAVTDLGLISRAARYHQDVDAQDTRLKGDVNAALASISVPSITRAAVMAALADDMSQVRLDMQQLDRMDLPSDIAESFGRVRELEEIYRTRANDTIKAVFENPHSGIALLPDFDKAFAALQVEMLKQTGALARRIVAANEAAEDASQMAKRWMLGTAIAISLTLCGLVGLLSASIRRSLRQVRDVAQAIAGGDLSARADASVQDEVGELAGAMNQLADNLSGMMDRLRNDADRDAFGTQLVEALEMADTEGEAYRVVARAMEVIATQLPMELLVADSSRSHLERATLHPSAGSPGCSVESPFSCVAVRRGSATTFQDSSAINSCPQLRNRPCGAVSAVCVPLSFMGHSLGVLHTTAPVNAPPSPKQVAQLSAIAQHAASRVGTLRVFHRTQLQASTDSLTGLSNRRTLEEHVRGLLANGLQYALVLCDLDHFKKLNDTHGHDAGDKALRVFADVLRGCMRSEDLPARWGGEEFALVLARATASQAAEAVKSDSSSRTEVRYCSSLSWSRWASAFSVETSRSLPERSFASCCFFFSRSSAERPPLSRTVTLCIGIATASLTVCVSMSAVALMPGRSARSLSETRILTMKFVTSSETVPELAVPLPVAPELSAEAAISRTTPLNLRSG